MQTVVDLMVSRREIGALTQLSLWMGGYHAKQTLMTFASASTYRGLMSV